MSGMEIFVVACCLFLGFFIVWTTMGGRKDAGEPPADEEKRPGPWSSEEDDRGR